MEGQSFRSRKGKSQACLSVQDGLSATSWSVPWAVIWNRKSSLFGLHILQHKGNTLVKSIPRNPSI